jgi:hypothetical protein
MRECEREKEKGSKRKNKKKRREKTCVPSPLHGLKSAYFDTASMSGATSL